MSPASSSLAWHAAPGDPEDVQGPTSHRIVVYPPHRPMASAGEKLFVCALVLAACARREPPPDAARPPAGSVVLHAPAAPSYSTAHGSTARSGRVAAMPATYAPLARRPRGWPADFPSPSVGEWGKKTDPRFVFVSPGARRVVVDWGHTYDLRDADGNFVAARDDEGRRFVWIPDGLMVDDDQLITKDYVLSFSSDGHLRVRSGCTGGSVLVEHVDADRCLAVVVNPGHPHGGGESLQIESGGLHDPQSAQPGVPLAVFREHIPIAAVMDSDGAVVFTSFWYDVSPAQAGLTGVPRVDRHWSVPLPRDWLRTDGLSLIPPYVALVGVAPGTSADRGRVLHVLDTSGRELWSVESPFDVAQPAIDCAGRICLAGDGLAATEGGRVVWSRFVGERVRATAFDDGSLAVAQRGELHVVSRDGADRQPLPVAEGETITTPPAIAHDGSIWVATAQAVYVARPQTAQSSRDAAVDGSR